MNFAELKSFLQQIVKEWGEDKASRLAASMAYYTVFSIPPLIIFVLSIAGKVFENANTQLERQLSALLGSRAAESVALIIENANQPGSNDSRWALIIGIVTLILGASGVFAQLQDALNTIWDVQPDPDRGIMGTIKARLFSYSLVLGVAFLLLVSLILSAGLSQLTDILTGGGEDLAILGQALNLIISFVVITGLFALMFKYIPDVIIQWRDVWRGALMTALMFTIGKFAIGLYLGQSTIADNYGAAGALIILLLWVNYSSQILFFGAEFTQVYANRYGSKVVPDEDAISLDTETRMKQGIPKRETLEKRKEGEPAVLVAGTDNVDGSASLPATTAQVLTPVATPPPHNMPLADREPPQSTLKRAALALVPIFAFLLLRHESDDS